MIHSPSPGRRGMLSAHARDSRRREPRVLPDLGDPVMGLPVCRRLILRAQRCRDRLGLVAAQAPGAACRMNVKLWPAMDEPPRAQLDYARPQVNRRSPLIGRSVAAFVFFGGCVLCWYGVQSFQAWWRGRGFPPNPSSDGLAGGATYCTIGVVLIWLAVRRFRRAGE